MFWRDGGAIWRAALSFFNPSIMVTEGGPVHSGPVPNQPKVPPSLTRQRMARRPNLEDSVRVVSDSGYGGGG